MESLKIYWRIALEANGKFPLAGVNALRKSPKPSLKQRKENLDHFTPI